jgi:arabinose-5-phosphate isomerase
MSAVQPLSGEVIRDRLIRVLEIEAAAIRRLACELTDSATRAVKLLLTARGRIIVSGVGKSGHVGRKIAATLASTGAPAMFVHPTEASHGDLGMITADDVCLVLSNSGETAELADLITHSRRFAIPLIAITKRAESTLGTQADVVLVLPNAPEACSIGMAPTTSTTMSLALGDALAVALMQERGFVREDFLVYHPGGKLGSQLVKVGRLMHTDDALPVLSPGTLMSEGLLTMTAKGFGVAAVEEGGKLVGVITDGDLRRNIEGLLACRAGDIATRSPVTVRIDTLASEALRLMSDRSISALFVINEQEHIVGLLHIHDCLRAGVA